MNFFIKPVDPFVQDNNDLFHADEKMHYILENNNIQSYLNYVKNKQKLNNSEIKPKTITEINPSIKQDYIYNPNNYKKLILQNMWSDIFTLENTIKKFKF